MASDSLVSAPRSIGQRKAGAQLALAVQGTDLRWCQLLMIRVLRLHLRSATIGRAAKIAMSNHQMAENQHFELQRVPYGQTIMFLECAAHNC